MLVFAPLSIASRLLCLPIMARAHGTSLYTCTIESTPAHQIRVSTHQHQHNRIRVPENISIVFSFIGMVLCCFGAYLGRYSSRSFPIMSSRGGASCGIENAARFGFGTGAPST